MIRSQHFPLLHAGLAVTLPLLALAGCGQGAMPTSTEAAMPAEGQDAPLLPESGITANEPSGRGAASDVPVSVASVAMATRAPVTTPLTNIAGMNAAKYAPTARSTFMDVTPDGKRVAIAWLSNRDAAGAFSRTGEPVTYATVGDPTIPSSFRAPMVIGKRMYAYAATATSYHKKYNSDHNAPFVIGTATGGFVGLANPMNANGYAQNMLATPYGYARSELSPGGTSWSGPYLAGLSAAAQGSSLSEMSGNGDPAGGIHVFGQGHRGQFQSGFGYQRRRPGVTTWESRPLAAAYRTGTINYFVEGGGYASRVKNAKGTYDIHAAFAWNQAGIKPLFGLSYLVSRDGGTTWQTAAGKVFTGPVTHADTSAAVFHANLSATRYSGSVPGYSTIGVSATDDGAPLIVRPNASGALNTKVLHRLYTYTAGKWVSVNVGPALFWNSNGNGVSRPYRDRRVDTEAG